MSLQPPPSREKLPVNNGWAEMPRAWIKYFTDLAAQATAAATTTWQSISKTGSSLSDLETRNHADLQNINTADYAHMYLADRDALVGGGQTALHKHDHAEQDNLNSANYTHLTAANATDLTDGGATTLHKHDHAAQDNMNSASYSHLTGDEKDATLDIIGTCLISNCALSINTDTTKFNVAAGILYFADSYTDPTNPTFTPVTYAGSTANSVTNLATQDATYVSIGADGTLYQTAVKPVAGDTRDKVLLGALVHTNRTSITSADSNTNVIGFDVPNCLSDISYAIGPINEGNLYSGNVTNTLRIDKSAGYIWQIGINWKNDKKNPNRITAAATTGASHLATWRDGAGGWTTLSKTDVIPNRYDDGTGGATTPSGVLATNKWQAIKIFYLPNSALTGLEYGQVVYNSLAEAEASKDDPTTDNPALSAVPFRGWLMVRGGATDLNDPADATFIDAGRFGQTTSGAGTGSSTTSLQEAYLNSSQPQITTDSTSGAFQVKRGSAADTDTVFEVLNGAGTPVMSVTGERATLTAPALGTPLSGTLTNCTGLPISTGVSGLGTGVAAGLANAVTGSGSPVLATSPTTTNHTVEASSGDALTVTNTGTGNSLVVNDAAGDTSPVVIDADGRLLKGTTTANTLVATAAGTDTTPGFQVATAGTTAAALAQGVYGFFAHSSTATGACSMRFIRSRANSLGDVTIVQDSDVLGNITFSGADGTHYVQAASIACTVNGTPASNDMPGALLFNTTPSGTIAPALVLQLSQDKSALFKFSVKSDSATGGIGYGTGAGGTVTQATSKATGVTLNKVTGNITMNNATLNAGTIVSFVLTNSAIAATDYLDVQHISGGTLGEYHTQASCASGSATIYVKNTSAGNLSEAIVLKFYLHKAVTA